MKETDDDNAKEEMCAQYTTYKYIEHDPSKPITTIYFENILQTEGERI